jgi:predicted  nucleic acid-binding Zn-ribbon protein
VNCAVLQGCCKCGVDQFVLVEQGEPVEARTRHRHLKVVAAARPVLDAKLARIGKRTAKERFETLDSHAAMLLAARLSAGSGIYAVAGTSWGAGVCLSYVGS